jgi:NADPH-dependent curcumin reductase CurA
MFDGFAFCIETEYVEDVDQRGALCQGGDYRASDLDAQIPEACSEGIDVYCDNAEGEISEAVMRHLAAGARVVICSTASVETWAHVPLRPRVERILLVKRARMQGFVIFDHAHKYDEARQALIGWMKTGQIRYLEDVLDGIEHAPNAIVGLYRGENLGKRLIRIADLDSI